MIESPLNYTGGKFKLLPQILQHFPNNINKFVDLFCGGCNVGINVDANEHIFNDSCQDLVQLYQTMQKLGSEVFLGIVCSIIDKYSLSDTSSFGYKYYGCNSSQGLGKYNKEKYRHLRDDFNLLKNTDEMRSVMLYVLIVYSFNNQIRFNGKGEFNLPVGKRDFNARMQTKLERFISQIQNPDIKFLSTDFRNFKIESIDVSDFVYADPPYLITCASYNELGGWTEEDERDLLKYLDKLTANEIKFALSNVLESNGNENTILKEWVEANSSYKVLNLDFSYNNSNYHKRNRELSTKEVLIINY